MIIRKANMKDSPHIRAIIKELNVDRNSSEDTGFVELDISKMKNIENSIKKNPYFYVAEENGYVIGFFSNYTQYHLSSMNNDCEIVEHLLDKNKKTLFIAS